MYAHASPHALVVSCLLVIGACAAGTDGTKGTDGTGAAAAAADSGPTLPRSFADVSEVTCRLERDTLTAAVEAFVLLTPATPVVEAALVEEHFLRETSAWFDVEPDGAVVPAPGSPCA